MPLPPGDAPRRARTALSQSCPKCTTWGSITQSQTQGHSRKTAGQGHSRLSRPRQTKSDRRPSPVRGDEEARPPGAAASGTWFRPGTQTPAKQPENQGRVGMSYGHCVTVNFLALPTALWLLRHEHWRSQGKGKQTCFVLFWQLFCKSEVRSKHQVEGVQW